MVYVIETTFGSSVPQIDCRRAIVLYIIYVLACV